MDQIGNHADNRLLNGCIYCGGYADTRDHVPSRTLLDAPYPENLPVVAACVSCNNGFSRDEEYLVCLIESALAGSTEPTQIQRPSVAKILRRSPALRSRIESAKKVLEDRIEFMAEQDRVMNVMLKLARGHAAFELSQPCRENPTSFWCGPLSSLSQEDRNSFDAAHVVGLLGEVGSRASLRMMAVEAKLKSETGTLLTQRLLMQDWIDAQDGYYRYIAIDDIGGIVINIVVREYLACQVRWNIQ